MKRGFDPQNLLLYKKQKRIGQAKFYEETVYRKRVQTKRRWKKEAENAENMGHQLIIHGQSSRYHCSGFSVRSRLAMNVIYKPMYVEVRLGHGWPNHGPQVKLWPAKVFLSGPQLNVAFF